MKYLVVCDMQSGYAEISNVLVIEADSENEAKETARDLQHRISSNGFEAYKLEDITTPWAFYW
jgi:hypothetical protein